MIEYTGTHTPQDFIRGVRLATRHTARFESIVMGLLFVAVLALSVSGDAVRGRNMPILIISTVLLLTFVVKRTVLIPRMVAREYARQSQAGKPFTTRVDETGFSTVQGSDSSSRRWSDFTGWQEDRDYIVLREGRASRIVPKRVFRNASDLEEMRRILATHIGPAK